MSLQDEDLKSTILAGLLGRSSKLSVVSFLVTFRTPQQLAGLWTNNGSRVIRRRVLFQGFDNAFDVISDLIRLLGEVAHDAVFRNSMMVDGSLDLDSGLLIREARADADSDLEDATVQVSHGLSKVRQQPHVWVVVLQLDRQVVTLLLPKMVSNLFELSLHACRLGGFSLLESETLGSPFARLFIDHLLDTDETSAQITVAEFPVHRVPTSFKRHLGKVGILLVFWGVLFDGGHVGLVVPEESSFEEIAEWFKLEFRFGFSLSILGFVVLVSRCPLGRAVWCHGAVGLYAQSILHFL